MRLVNALDLTLVDFADDQIPPYAILSHTWEGDEVSFADLQKEPNLLSPCHRGHPKQKSIDKIRSFCEAIHKTHSESDPNTHHCYGWVDTCCIDKSSSAELSEAINSMYRWYAAASVCFVFLSDLDYSSANHIDQFMRSRWFTRGWTLQELIAPQELVFYDKSWQVYGKRGDLTSLIATATEIPQEGIINGTNAKKFCVAEKMSWAANRKTTRSEDMAYCLLGLFDVNMPLLYGEGERKAFHRLQVEIMQQTPDETVFAWQYSAHHATGQGMLAESPEQFKHSAGVEVAKYLWRKPYAMTHLGVQIEMDLHEVTRYENQIHGLIATYGIKALRAAAIRCRQPGHGLYVIILKGDGHLSYQRVGGLIQSRKKQLGPMTEVFIR